MVKISVIMPFYNVEYYIEETLDSIINQTIFDDIEVIIVDDGSTDKSRYLINEYVVNYDNIKFFHIENRGVSCARNYGMKYATGEYIHFMDSDDYLFYDAYEKLYNLAKKGDYEIVSGAFLRFTSWKTYLESISKYVYENINEPITDIQLKDYPNLTWDMLIWNKIYKREFIEKNNIQFVKGLKFQDNVFSIEVLSKTSKMALIPDYVYCWREREIGISESQSYNLKRLEDLIEVFHLVDKYIKENIDDEEILAKKYLKWLLLDIRGYVEIIDSYPEEYHEFFLENIYDIFNLIPKEYTKDLNTHFSVLYEILENKDWENLLIYSPNFYKKSPTLPTGLKEEYAKKINSERDAIGEELDIYTTKVSEDGENIKFNFDYNMPYILKDEAHEIKVKLLNIPAEEKTANAIKKYKFKSEKENCKSIKEYELDSKYIGKNEFCIPKDLIEFGENILMMTYKSGAINKEYYLKTIARESYSYESFDLDVARGQSSYLRLIKRKKDKSNYIIKEVRFKDKDYFELIGVSNNNHRNILIKDYLDFVKFKYQMNYEKLNEEEYKFSVKIPYNDILKAPIKKWDFYLDGEFNKLNLEESCEFINKNYRIYLKNHGNRTVIELFRYDPIDTITNLNNEKNKLITEKQSLINDKKRLNEEKNQLNNDKNRLNDEKEKLKNEKNRLIKERDELKGKNKRLEEKIEEYKNRKDVRAVDSIKKTLHR